MHGHRYAHADCGVRVCDIVEYAQSAVHIRTRIRIYMSEKSNMH